MKKLSRSVAIILVICMTILAIGSLGVCAENEFSLVTWDADGDFITLDLSEEADLATMQDGVLLTESGKNVAFTVEYSRHPSTDEILLNKNEKLMDRYSYLIKPVNGISYDRVYTLSVNGVKSKDGQNTLPSFRKIFKVKKVGEGAQLADNQWKDFTKTTNQSDSTRTSDVMDGIKTEWNSQNGNEVYYQWYGEDKQLDMDSDYTIKVKYNVNPTDVSSVNLSLIGLVNHKTVGSPTNATYAKSVQLAAQLNKNATRKVTLKNCTTDTNYNIIKGNNTATFYQDIAFNSDIEFKLSMRKGYSRGFLNGKKVADNVYDGSASGFPALLISATNSGSKLSGVVCANDFIMTKLIDLSDIDSFDILSWNADSDFITLEFDEELDLDSLKESITLMKNGKNINFEVRYNRHENSSTSMISKYSYAVVPAEGMEIGAVYTIRVGDVLNKDSNKILNSFAKAFKVNLLDSGMTYLDGSEKNNGWAYHGGSYGENSFIVGASTADSLNITWKNKSCSTLFSHYNSQGILDKDMKDYTIKMRFKTQSDNCKGAVYQLFTMMQPDSGTGNRVDTKCESIEFRVFNTSDNGTAELYLGTTKMKSLSDKYPEVKLGNEVELKLAVKGKFVASYINSIKVADMLLEKELEGYPAMSCIANYSGETAADITTYLSDLKITKAEEISGISATDLAVKQNGVDVSSFASTGPIDIDTNILNETDDRIPVFAMCALYDSANGMVSCYRADISSVDAQSYGSIQFSNMSADGVVKAKVFIWDTAKNLAPYIKSFEFPKVN